MTRIIIVLVIAIVLAACPITAHAQTASDNTPSWGDGTGIVFYHCRDNISRVDKFPVWRTIITRWMQPWGCTVTAVMVPAGFYEKRAYQDSVFQVMVSGIPFP